jgi:hypothetical protein
MAAGGAGVLNTVERVDTTLPSSVRWLLVGSLAAAVAVVAALTMTLEVRRALPALYRAAGLALGATAVLIWSVGLTGWGAKGTLTAMVLLLGIPIATGLTIWRRQPEVDEVDLR